MVQKTYNFKITKATENECLQAMTAASTLVKNLSHEDLLMLADVVVNRPQLIDTARPFLKK